MKTVKRICFVVDKICLNCSKNITEALVHTAFFVNKQIPNL